MTASSDISLAATRTSTEQEDDARRITCKTCHAPVGVACVAIEWKVLAGRFEPYLVTRAFHPKRLKWFDKSVSKFGDHR